MEINQRFLKYLASARKGIRRIDLKDRRQIRDFLEKRLLDRDDPRELDKALRGELAQFWRYRVGAYRIICEIRDHECIVLVIRIAHRSSVYGQP